MHIPEISIYPEVHKIDFWQQQSSLTRGQKFLSRILLKFNSSNRVFIEVPLATLLRIGLSWYDVHSYRCPGRSLRISRWPDRSLYSFCYQVDLVIDLGIRVDRTIVFEVQVRRCIVFDAQIDLSIVLRFQVRRCIVFDAQIDLSIVLRFQVDSYILLAD